jgi:hypothetical protein
LGCIWMLLLAPPAAAAGDDIYGKYKFVLVGATKMCEVMTGLKIAATTLGTASLYPTKRNVEKLAADLSEFLEGLEPDPDKKTVVIFSHLDKSYFQARAEDGRYIPYRNLEGVYHVDGDLVACPMEHLKFLFEMMVPLFNASSALPNPEVPLARML